MFLVRDGIVGVTGLKSAFISLGRDGICWGLGSNGTQKCFYFFLMVVMAKEYVDESGHNNFRF